MQKYLHYQAVDFAADESFQQYVFRQDKEAVRFWENWIRRHPEKAGETTEAIQLLNRLRPQKLPAGIDQEAELQKLQEKIRNTSRFTGKRKIWYWVAALAGLFALAVPVKYLLGPSTIVHQTTYGEKAAITLPDSSVVILNGNSSVEYARSWSDRGPREVWLDGEAYFSVVHTPRNRKFLVRAAGEFSIEVLGTEFNVSRRKSATRVVLSSGEIRLKLGAEAPGDRSGEVAMRPGELVEFKDVPGQYVKKQVDPRHYSSWKDGKLVFEESRLDEIALLLEETYGITVAIPDTSLRSQRFSGTVRAEHADALLEGLSLLFDLTVTRHGNQALVERAKP